MISLLFTGIQAMFLREHNQIVKDLTEINPKWKDNELYEEARKITIAFFQRIVYSDWLPILFGADAYKEHFGPIGESDYDKKVRV